ncbi:MAG: large conductance mechanosensitive channel protein MscL [Phycisphaerae bacterium]
MSLLKDFKNFAFKGNLIDLAVAFVIGSAFSGIVTAMVNDIIMPAISFVTPSQSYTKWTIDKKILIGHFIGAVLNFFIIAVALFIIVVLVIGQIHKLTTKPPPPAAPTTKECPFCCSTIPIKAVRCGQCTSELPPPATAAPAAPAA